MADVRTRVQETPIFIKMNQVQEMLTTRKHLTEVIYLGESTRSLRPFCLVAGSIGTMEHSSN